MGGTGEKMRACFDYIDQLENQHWQNNLRLLNVQERQKRICHWSTFWLKPLMWNGARSLRKRIFGQLWMLQNTLGLSFKPRHYQTYYSNCPRGDWRGWGFIWWWDQSDGTIWVRGYISLSPPLLFSTRILLKIGNTTKFVWLTFLFCQCFKTNISLQLVIIKFLCNNLLCNMWGCILSLLFKI